MIINKENYKCLWDIFHKPYVVDKVYKNYFPFNWTDSMEVYNESIFYIEYFGSECFTTFNIADYIPKQTLEEIKKGNVTLLLHNSGHGYHETIENIYKEVIIKFDIPCENVIISSESADMYDIGVFFSKKLNMPMVRYLWATEFEAYYSNYAKHQRVRYNEFSTSKQYLKKYLCLNGYYRRHRAALVSLLESLDLINLGIVSFNIKEGGEKPEETYQFMLDFFSHIPEVKELLVSNEHKLKTLNHILLDRPYNSSDNLAVVMKEHDDYFNDTYFSVITETNFPPFDPPYHIREIPIPIGRVFSEKIFRAIFFKHPFIVVSNPRFLKLIKRLGYKTFEGLIDESYDLEEDNSLRIWKIVNEIKRLSNFSSEQIIEFNKQVKDICEYNFEVLKNKSLFCQKLPIP